MRKLTLILFSLFLTCSLFSQTETDLEREFLFKGHHYVPHSPWWTVGTGYSYNFDEDWYEPNFMLDVHFRILEKHYVGIGFVTSREQFLDKNGPNIFLPHRYNNQSLNSLHALYGWRVEKLHHNLGFFAGPSFNWGYDYAYSDTLGDYHSAYMQPGLYASLEYTYKIFYDVGVGATLWGSINKNYQAAGLTIHIYFSSALKRRLKY